MSEVCENCGATIGKLEPAMLFNEHVVCEPCHAKLSSKNALSAADVVEMPPQQVVARRDVSPLEELAAANQQHEAGVFTQQGAVFQQSPGGPIVAVQQTVIVHQHQNESQNNAIAAMLSFLIPGLGQMYQGRVAEGVLWLVATFVGYFIMVCPGALLHLLCIISAVIYRPKRTRRSY
jgi:TM2 domain-containing membrane protein YozV